MHSLLANIESVFSHALETYVSSLLITTMPSSLHTKSTLLTESQRSMSHESLLLSSQNDSCREQCYFCHVYVVRT